MNALEKAREIADGYSTDSQGMMPIRMVKQEIKQSCLEMAQWKDEQYKTAYVVTRSDLHYDEVEKVFFDKEKAEEYCKPFNEDKDCYHRDITKIEVSL